VVRHDPRDRRKVPARRLPEELGVRLDPIHLARLADCREPRERVLLRDRVLAGMTGAWAEEARVVADVIPPRNSVLVKEVGDVRPCPEWDVPVRTHRQELV